MKVTQLNLTQKVFIPGYPNMPKTIFDGQQSVSGVLIDLRDDGSALLTIKDLRVVIGASMIECAVLAPLEAKLVKAVTK